MNWNELELRATLVGNEFLARHSLPNTTPEAALLAYVRRVAKQYSWHFYHTRDSRGSEKGYPDVTLVRDSVIYAELKTQTGKQTIEQVQWQRALHEAGAEFFLWRPSDAEAIVARLSAPRRR